MGAIDQSISWMRQELEQELGTIYAAQVWQDLQDTIDLYAIYDGTGQTWEVAAELDYKPTQRITNHIKHLIKEVARFMLSRAPEITIQPDGKDDKNEGLCAELESWVRQVLEENGWAGLLPKAGRDCFVGKRVALKVSGEAKKPLQMSFRPSVEFFYDVTEDDASKITKVIFYYHQNESSDRKQQRIWWQKYWMESGRCQVLEAVYNGYGERISGDTDPRDTGLDQIPVCVIVNDGLTGDLMGESDAAELRQSQEAYNRLISDDQDALRFNMFPMRIFKNASQESMEKLKISPGAIGDLSTDAAAQGDVDANILESQFGYDGRFEHAIDRVKKDMYQLLSVPEVDADKLKSLGISGKAMKALYWPLICRCEEKWAAWDTAIRWLVRILVKMAKEYGIADYTAAKYTIGIDHLYPIPDDEEDERGLDMQEVKARVRSRKAYVEKWQPTVDADAEIEQMAAEARMAEDGY